MRYTAFMITSAILCAGFLIFGMGGGGDHKKFGVKRVNALSVASLWAGDDDARARILVDNDDPTMAGIVVQMRQGWHTYWHTPGDAGLAPQFTWNNTVNMKSADVFWPAPKRFDEAGFTTFGYADRVVFPVRFKAINDNKPIRGDLNIDMMICKDICIPKTLAFSFDTAQTVSVNTGDKNILKQAFDNLTTRHADSDNGKYTLQNVQIFDDRLEVFVTILPQYSAAGILKFPLQKDIDAMDIFAVVYDNVGADVDAGTPLMGAVTKTFAGQLNRHGVTFTLKNTDDIKDLNAYTRGKIVHVVITHKDGGISRDINVPTPKTGSPKDLKARVKQSRARRNDK